jgi:hypothetical protein
LVHLEPPFAHGHLPGKKPGTVPGGWKFETLYFPLDALVLAPLRRSCGGAYMAITNWRLHADPALAPLRRSSTGAITPITVWRHYGDR